MDRRGFIGSVAAAGAACCIESVKSSPLASALKAEMADVAKDGFDEDLIVFISDLHLNPGKYQENRLVRAVSNILAMKPLPRNVIALGDLAYLTGKPGDYAELKKVLVEPLESAGITLTLAMGNHDRRENFRDAFPLHAAKSVFKDRYVYVVKTRQADVIVLDSLQQGEDDTTWITPGKLNDEQTAWLKETLSSYGKPVFVSSHHPVRELGIEEILLSSPDCAGYIYGHDHIWRPEWIIRNYNDKAMVRTLCLPSTGHWGDIGLMRLQIGDKSAVAELRQWEYFFPYAPHDDVEVPALWKAIVEDNQGLRTTFVYERPK